MSCISTDVMFTILQKTFCKKLLIKVMFTLYQSQYRNVSLL